MRRSLGPVHCVSTLGHTPVTAFGVGGSWVPGSLLSSPSLTSRASCEFFMGVIGM